VSLYGSFGDESFGAYAPRYTQDYDLMPARPHLFRSEDTKAERPVTYIELFFDLVFVFAITQLSHYLLGRLNQHGAMETLVAFLAIWWVWIFTSWTTNWLDPDRGAVRFMMIMLMFGGLALSAAVPDAFGKSGLLFAGSYCAMQIGRTLYMVWAANGVHDARQRNFLRIVFYFVLALPLWIWGAWQTGDVRLYAWAVAIGIEYAGPFVYFRTPFLGRSQASDWDISGAHMAERCALFIIIALGEAVLVTGATYADLEHEQSTTIAFVTTFMSSAAMWWIYFDIGAKRGSSMISEADNAGQIARNAYTYLHMPIVAGIVVTAVGDEMVLAHPHGDATLEYVLVACGGPMLFLFGNQTFKWITSGARLPPLSHFIGQIVLIGVGWGGYAGSWQPLTIAISATAALVLTAIWEWFSLNGGWRRWLPWLERRELEQVAED
jgi:low temperature requirement protein LtrA